jgi:hypothetical protein
LVAVVTPPQAATRRVLVVVVLPVDELDLVGPLQVFSAVNRLAGRPVYAIDIVTTIAAVWHCMRKTAQIEKRDSGRSLADNAGISRLTFRPNKPTLDHYCDERAANSFLGPHPEVRLR